MLFHRTSDAHGDTFTFTKVHSGAEWSKVEVVKLINERFRLGLRDSKRLIDALETAQSIEIMEPLVESDRDTRMRVILLKG